MNCPVIGSGIWRAEGPHCQSAYFWSTSEIPNVARMVVRGSRPMSGRSVVAWSGAPKTAMTRAAASSASQKLPVSAIVVAPDEAAQHDEVAVGEVDDVHDAEDERQPRGDEGQDHAVDDPVDGLDEDLLERDAHGSDPEVLVDDAWSVAQLGGGRVVAHLRPSP